MPPFNKAINYYKKMTMKLQQRFFIYALTILVSIFSNKLLAQSKKIIIEDFTGSWCGLCPAGFITSDSLSKTYGDKLIMVSEHMSDPMSVSPECTEMGDMYSGGGVNVFLLDRYLFESEQFIQFDFDYAKLAEKIEARLAQPTPASITIDKVTYDTTLQKITVKMTTIINQNIENANLRLNIWFVEDSLISTESGYEQVNFFADLPDYGYYTNAGNPIPNFAHRHVLLDMLGDTWGIANSLPTNIIANKLYTRTFSKTIPNTWNTNNLYIITSVQEYDESNIYKRAIWNAEQISLKKALEPVIDTAVWVQNSYDKYQTNSDFLQIIPNISTQNEAPNMQIQLNIPTMQPQNSIDIALYNSIGQKINTIYNGLLNNGLQTIPVHNTFYNLPKGVYFLKLVTENGLISAKKFIIL